MKLIHKGVLYLNREDVNNISSLPYWVNQELEEYQDVYKITNSEIIDYFNLRSEILDYNVISTYSDEQIDELIQKNKHKLNSISNLWGNVNHQRSMIEKREYIKRKIDNLEDYKNNREKYDMIFKRIKKSMSLNLVKED